MAFLAYLSAIGTLTMKGIVKSMAGPEGTNRCNRAAGTVVIV